MSIIRVERRIIDWDHDATCLGWSANNSNPPSRNGEPFRADGER
ncbi:hypothetical protein [Oryzifoliimicrobium ureilyticus]